MTHQSERPPAGGKAGSAESSRQVPQVACRNSEVSPEGGGEQRRARAGSVLRGSLGLQCVTQQEAKPQGPVHVAGAEETPGLPAAGAEPSLVLGWHVWAPSSIGRGWVMSWCARRHQCSPTPRPSCPGPGRVLHTD